MDMELITQIFELCIIPLLGILTRYIIKFVDAKAEELNAKAKNELARKYTTEIANTIKKCVKATNQTYVDSLKQQGQFDEKAQEQAFNKTLNAVITILSAEAKNYIIETTGDLRMYLTQLIESDVQDNKQIKEK